MCECRFVTLSSILLVCYFFQSVCFFLNVSGSKLTCIVGNCFYFYNFYVNLLLWGGAWKEGFIRLLRGTLHCLFIWLVFLLIFCILLCNCCRGWCFCSTALYICINVFLCCCCCCCCIVVSMFDYLSIWLFVKCIFHWLSAVALLLSQNIYVYIRHLYVLGLQFWVVLFLFCFHSVW